MIVKVEVFLAFYGGITNCKYTIEVRMFRNWVPIDIGMFIGLRIYWVPMHCGMLPG